MPTMTDSGHNNKGEEPLPPNNGSEVSNNDGPANNNLHEQQIQLQRSIVSSSENSVTSNSTVSAKTVAGLATAVVNGGAATACATDVKPEASEEGEKAENMANEDAPITSTKNTNAVLLQMSAPPHYPVAEFLFQLTKMLTDDNQEFIEWKKASILVHDPPGLEKQILPKYFRHSNYSSFQRQMNYFGFRKIAGKGKMAACSYVNENATEDISSLLYIKRKKTGAVGTTAKLLAQANKINRRAAQAATLGMDAQMGAMNNMMMLNGVNPLMLGGNIVGMMVMNPQQQLLLLQQQNANLLGMNGLQGINGLQLQGMNGLQGMGVMGGGINGLNMLVSKPGQAVGAVSNNLNSNESTRMSQQQQILAQLQQAHASASSGLDGSTAGNNTLPNQALKNTFGINGIQGTAPILTNDQGNLYNAGSGQANMTNPTSVNGANSQAQVLLMQQAAAMGGLGSFTQGGLGVAPSTTANSNEKGLDAGANFRLLLNQQINQFSTGNQASAPPSGTPRDGNQGTSTTMNMNPQQGLSYEQFFQLNGMANGGAAPAANNGNAQQFLQRNNAT